MPSTHHGDRPEEIERTMHENDPAIPHSRSRRCLSAVSAFIALAVVALLFSTHGCKKQPTAVDEDASKPEERCYETLSSAVYMLDPTRLGTTTKIDDVVSRLNDWSRQCGKEVEVSVEFTPETQKLLLSILTESQITDLEDGNFGRRDILHVRNAILMRGIVEPVLQASKKDLDRVVDLFYSVVRNVQLIKRDADTPRVPPFRILLFGRGTAEDRAWVFAELLRQLKIPAVILNAESSSDPKAAQPEKERSTFLVGALLDERVYLFDTRLGLPIPNAAEHTSQAPLPRIPATLAEYVQDPSIRAQLGTSDSPYTISPMAMKKPGIALIGHRSMWSLRMKQLNFSLVGTSKPVLYDELDVPPSQENPEENPGGLIQLVVEVGKGRWSRGDVKLWAYPEKSYQSFDQPTPAQNKQITAWGKSFHAPIGISFDEKTNQPKIGGPERVQFRARVRHLMGKHKEATRLYMGVQRECLMSPQVFVHYPLDIQAALKSALEDSWLWIQTIKLEQQHENVSQGFELHLQRYSSGTRINQARFLAAFSDRLANRFNSARQYLSGISAESPLKPGAMVLHRRWGRQQLGFEKKAKKETEPKPKP